MTDSRAAIRDLVILTTSFVLIFMGAGAQQQFLVPFFRESTPWGALERSLVPAAVYIGMAMSRIPSVWIVSAIGERFGMLLGAACYIAFPALVWVAPPYGTLVIGAALWGVGASMLWLTSSIRVLDVVRESRYGSASGIFTSGSQVGFTAGVVILTYIAASRGLRDVFLAAMIVTALGWIILAFLPSGDMEREPPRLRTVAEIARSADGRVVIVLQAVSAAGFGLVLVPLSENIMATFGVSGLLLAVGYPAARFLVALVGGWLSDHLGRRATLSGSFFLAGIGLGWTAFAPASPLALGVGIFAIGLLGGLVPTLAMAYVGDVAHPSTRLMVHSTLFTGRDVGVAGAMIVGQILQVGLGGFGTTFGVFAALFLACGVWSAGLSMRRVASGPR